MFRLLPKALLACVALGMFSGPALAKNAEFELTATTQMMSTHPVVANAILPLFDLMEKNTHGRVHVTYYNPNTLMPEAEVYNGVLNGVIDLGGFVATRDPGRFPMQVMIELPFLFTNSRAASASIIDMMANNADFAKEFSAVVPFSFSTSVPIDLLSKTPIKTLEDMKGKRIGVASSTSVDAIKLLGSTPILLPVSDMYMSLQRGLVDAVFLPIPTYKSTKVTEVAKYLTKCNFAVSASPTVFSKKKYDAMPADIQAELNKLFGNAASVMRSSWVDKSCKEDLEYVLEKNGVEIVELSPEELARWKEKVQPMYDDWLNAVAKRGIDGQAALTEFQRLAEHYNSLDNVYAKYRQYKEVLGDLYFEL